jgi:hypothetical protein
MRIVALCWLGLTLALAGCCGSHDSPASTDTETKSSTPECEDCCSNASRAAILKRSLDAQKAAEGESQTK